jgi:pimeloyl-ACP methyl ester carboxylesterase/DNA-binding SARP family transcriptional activator
MTPRLCLFGLPRFLHAGTAGREEPVRLKRCALLLALLVAAPQGLSRAVLAERLWADGSEAVRRNRLRRLVHEARGQLGQSALVADERGMRLAPDWLDGCDLHVFCAQQQAAERDGHVADAEAAAMAVAAARMPLLGTLDFDESSPAAEWLAFQRAAQTVRRRRLRDALVDGWLAAHDDARALACLLEDVESDPVDERAAETAATLLHRAGRHEACVAVFRTLRRHLAAELGVDAAPSFHRLAAEAEARIAAGCAQAAAAAPIRYVENDGAHIAWQAFGTGPADLLLIPGFVSSLEMAWELPQLAGFLARLARRFRVILFDRRGMGLSDRLPAPDPLDQTVRDMRAVLDAAHCAAPLVLAASEGGPAGIALAVAHPRRVAGLCLFGTLAKGCAGDGYTAALSREQYDGWLEDMVARWGTPTALEAFCPTQADDPVLRAWWSRLLRLSSSPAALATVLAQLRDVDVRALLGRLACPVSLLHRIGDRAVRIDASRYMATRIPHAQLIELDGRDHFFWSGAHEPILEELDRLLDRRTAPSIGEFD